MVVYIKKPAPVLVKVELHKIKFKANWLIRDPFWTACLNNHDSPFL